MLFVVNTKYVKHIVTQRQTATVNCVTSMLFVAQRICLLIEV